jgi:DNA-binding LacI/PurR family transcriptional regulator
VTVGSTGRPRLKDVAALAGVSVKTVSNVVNGYVHVSAAMRERVQAAIDQLGYRPNLVARGLRSGRSGVIALAVPELDLPYFAELARLVVNAAEARGYTVLVDQTEGSPERERVAVAGIRDHLVDGVIFSPLGMAAADLAARHPATPLVLIGERTIGGSADRVGLVGSADHVGLVGSADHVGIDNVAAAADATGHLIERGRRRIAAIGGQHASSGATARLRAAGYRSALAAAGLPVDDGLIAPAPAFHRADGAAAMAALLDRADPPDAVFCFNDTLALGALRTLHERGVRVPDDVAVIGFDDIEDGRFATPSLSTVAPDKAGIARSAVELLIGRIETDPDAPSREVPAGHRLIARESTLGRPNTHKR